jgi:hypothetical protein
MVGVNYSGEGIIEFFFKNIPTMEYHKWNSYQQHTSYLMVGTDHRGEGIKEKTEI